MLPCIACLLLAMAAFVPLPLRAPGLAVDGGLALARPVVLFAIAVVRALFLALAFADGLWRARLWGVIAAACLLGALALFANRRLALLLAIGRFALALL